MDQTLIRGDVNQLQCILDFQKRGYYCSIPFSGSCRYDVVTDINNHLYRVQCKSCTYKKEDGVLVMSATRQTTNTKTTIQYKYSKDEIDYFYTSWEKYSFLIPVEEVSTSKYLRIDPPLSGIQETMCLAYDYLLDNVIKSIINQKSIEKYKDNRIISFNENGDQKLWNIEELKEKYDERQIRYIKEKIMKDGFAYGIKWKYKEFPIL